MGCKVEVGTEVDTGCTAVEEAEEEVVRWVAAADISVAAAAAVAASDFGDLRTHNSRTKPIALAVDAEAEVLVEVHSTDLAAEQLQRPNKPNNRAAVEGAEVGRVAVEVVGNLGLARRDFCAY